jgi:SAM-dependent methyltransferase
VKNGHATVLWPKDMNELAAEEAEHHDHDHSDASEVHQLNRPRNFVFHERLWHTLRTVDHGSNLLEIGAGTGFDAKEIVGDYALTLSDVSPQTLNRTAAMLGGTMTYVAADGARLPFADEQFRGVYMVATLHHLPDPVLGIRECARVLQPGGLLCIWIEPNMTYFRPIKYLRKFLCAATHMKPEDGSHADAEMEGFSYVELKHCFAPDVWSEVDIRPMWFILGWWHYFSEFLFRALRLRTRIALPIGLEKWLVRVDDVLLKIPGMKHLCWHWTISAKKK